MYDVQINYIELTTNKSGKKPEENILLGKSFLFLIHAVQCLASFNDLSGWVARIGRGLQAPV